MIRTLFLTALAVTCGNAVFGADIFNLVMEGKPVATFDFASVTNAVELKSVREDIGLFNRRLAEVTGVTLPENVERGNVIRLDIRPIRELERRFDWRISFPSDREMVVEATTTSLFTALRQLLEEGCDARFLGVERCMFQFEPRRNVSVAVRDRASARRCYTLNRATYFLPGHVRELGMSDDGLFKYSHGMPVYAFPMDKYNAEGWPETVMPILHGRRLERPDNGYNRWQPCYSSPAAAEIAVTNMLDYLRRHRDTFSLTLGVNDNGGYCECESCRKMDDGAPASIFSNDARNHSPSYYTFVNSVAGRLDEEFPGLRIGLLAYTGTIMPPPFPVARNVVPVMTFDTLAAGMDPAVRARQDKVIAAWGEKVRETGIWDYCWGRSFDLPRVDFAGHAQRLKFLYEHGGRAYFGENSRMADMLDGPKTYLIARLLEDVDASPDAILNDWFARFAGRAAKDELRSLYRACEGYWRSERMKRTPTYDSRTWIYTYPDGFHLMALVPGFTETLVARARRVLALARTPGERKRAGILLRHFQYLDCVASFGGFAYGMPESGELATAGDAAAMLNELADRLDGLLAEWGEAVAYFKAPDLDEADVYVRRDLVKFDICSLLSEQFARAVGFRSDPAVQNAIARVVRHPHLPKDALERAKTLLTDAAWTEVGDFKTADDAANDGDVVYRAVRGRSQTVDLSPGGWAVSVEIETPLFGRAVNVAVWRQLDGEDRAWTGPAWTPLEAGRKRIFTKVVTVDDTVDGVNVHIHFRGFGKDDPVTIGRIRTVCLSKAVKSGRCGKLSAQQITAREGAERKDVLGVPAVVAKGDVYAFAHAIVNFKRIKSGERLVFTLKAASPAAEKPGALGAMLYEKDGGGWKQPTSPLVWKRKLSEGRFENVGFSVAAEALGQKNGDFLLILFKMMDSGPVAVSDLGWKVE